MKTNESNRKNIENIIMATDTILHTDWMDRLDAYIENRIEEETEKRLAKQANWYRAFILFLLVLFIGWYCMFGRMEKRVIVQNETEYCTECSLQ